MRTIDRTRSLSVQFQTAIADCDARLSKLPVTGNTLEARHELAICKQVFDNMSAAVQTYQTVDRFFRGELQTGIADFLGLKSHDMADLTDATLKTVNVTVVRCLDRIHKINTRLEGVKNGTHSEKQAS